MITSMSWMATAVDWSWFAGQDLLSQEGLTMIKQLSSSYLEMEVGFSLLALAPERVLPRQDTEYR